MKAQSLKSSFCPATNNSDRKPGIRGFLRPLAFGITIGLAMGLATRNVGVGLALGVGFATANGAFNRRVE